MVASVVEPEDLDVAQLAARERPLSSTALAQLTEAIREELQRQIRLAARSHGFSRSRVVKRALVHLFGAGRSPLESRLFYLSAARSMRKILLERARATTQSVLYGCDTAALDDSLRRLEVLAPRHAQVIDLHYFSGFSLREVATLLDMTESALARDIRFIKAWLTNTRNHRAPSRR